MKKVLSLALVLMMVVLLGSVSVLGVSTGKFSMGNSSGKAGDTVTVTVTADVNPGIAATLLEIGYNSDLVLKKVENGVVFPNDKMTPGGDLTANPYNVTWMDAGNQNHDATGVMVTLTFEIKSTAKLGRKEITLAYSPNNTFNVSLDPVTFTTSSGYVDVVNPVELSSIAVTKQPSRTEYTVGETLDTAGMVVTATYTDGTSKDVTGYSCDPVTLNAAGTQTVTVTYTEGGVTKTAAFSVTVKEEGEVTVTILPPSVTTIRYIDALYLHAVTENLPEGAKLVWKVEGGGIMIAKSGENDTCQISDHPDNCVVCKVLCYKRGTSVVTCTVCDENGEPLPINGEIVQDSVELTGRSNIFMRIFDIILTLLFGKIYYA